MSDKEKYIIYTAADIEQYLAGNLSPLQMHAMEKAALDDPFLAEAMEGFEGMKEKNWDIQLSALRKQVSEKGSGAKVIPLHKSTGRWWKIAAAIFVTGAGTLLTFILTKNNPQKKPDQQIAQTIISKTDTGTLSNIAVLSQISDSAQPVTLLPAKGKEVIASTHANGLIAQTNPPVKMDDHFVYRPVTPQLYDSLNNAINGFGYIAPNIPPAGTGNNSWASASNNVQSAESNYNADYKATSNTEETNRQIAAGINKKEQGLNNYFTAQVVAADNSPLPFTNISIKKENFGTYADAKGIVRLVSSDSVLNIEVKSVGYLPRTFTLHSNNLPQNKIVLAEDVMALKDMRVIGNKDIGLNKKSHRATLLIDSVVNVEPADGWENYNTYIANNIDIPEEMLKKDFHGEVELVFDVKANGAISNVRIHKSLGAAYDEEARRLILEGPQWKVKKGKKTFARVKVQF